MLSIKFYSLLGQSFYAFGFSSHHFHCVSILYKACYFISPLRFYCNDFVAILLSDFICMHLNHCHHLCPTWSNWNLRALFSLNSPFLLHAALPTILSSAHIKKNESSIFFKMPWRNAKIHVCNNSNMQYSSKLIYIWYPICHTNILHTHIKRLQGYIFGPCSKVL